jgi:hypothetical protein
MAQVLPELVLAKVRLSLVVLVPELVQESQEVAA